MERIILHSDLNSFYASVEMMLDPSLRGKAVAVCGSTEDGTEFYHVELVAPQEIRLERNAAENRLLHKASKRDLAASNRRLVEDDEKHRMESHEGEIPFEQYMKIDNSNLCPNWSHK